MTDAIRKKIEEIKSSTEPDDLRKHLCPFFEKGGCPECIVCDKSEASLQECKDVYLDRIISMPMLVWREDFENPVALSRKAVSPDEINGVGISCNRCVMSSKCPLYKKDYVCGIDWGSDRPATSTEFMDFLISMQYERVRRASVFEKVDGGVPDAGLSSEMDRLHGLIRSKSDMGRDRLSISVEASSATPQSSGGGILAKLFGGGTPALPEKKPAELPENSPSFKDTIDIQDAVEVKDEHVKVPRQRKK